MADKRDCYEILGINKSATDDEIKKAFRRLAKQYHPDANPGDKAAEEKFKEINEAYSILSDPEKKSNYDRFGYAGVDPSAGGGGFGGGFSGGFDMGDIFDMFGGMFGGGSRRSYANAPTRGEDIGIKITVDFFEALFGCKKEISFSRIEKCGECGGSGAAKGTTASTCRKCGGSGTINVQQRTVFGIMQSTVECDECGGKGRIIQTPCKECRGNGILRKKKTLEVEIPAGIDNGQRIVHRGNGDCGTNGGPAGDLYIQVAVKPDSLYKRDGFNLRYELPITFADAALGGKITVPTPDGLGELTVPEGTQTGSTFSIKGRGVPMRNGRGRGDLLITVNVETPKGLSKKQKELLQEFSESFTEKNHAKKKSFFDKFKK